MRNIEAQTGFNNHVPSGKGYNTFVPRENNFIDAEAYQDQQLILMLRERAAARRHQSQIIEVW